MAQNYTVYSAVYREIKKGIMTLHLVPGTEMSTQEIATKLQVSRTPVREAFIQLQKEGLVETIPQKGTKVSRINIRRVEQERFLRESLELAVIGLFLKNVNDFDLKKLRDMIREQKLCCDDKNYAEFIYFDNKFHKMFFDVAEQQLSWELISNYNGHYDRIRTLTIQEDDTMIGTIGQHEKIVDLVEQKNVDAVQEELKHHVRKIIWEKEALLQLYPDYFISGEEQANGILNGSL